MAFNKNPLKQMNLDIKQIFSKIGAGGSGGQGGIAGQGIRPGI